MSDYYDCDKILKYLYGGEKMQKTHCDICDATMHKHSEKWFAIKIERNDGDDAFDGKDGVYYYHGIKSIDLCPACMHRIFDKYINIDYGDTYA